MSVLVVLDGYEGAFDTNYCMIPESELTEYCISLLSDYNLLLSNRDRSPEDEIHLEEVSNALDIIVNRWVLKYGKYPGYSSVHKNCSVITIRFV